MNRRVVLLALAFGSFLGGAVDARATGITQPADAGACVTELAIVGCSQAPLGAPNGVARAGNHLYVSSVSDDRIRIFDIDPLTGLLTARAPGPTSCIAAVAQASTCAPARVMDGPGRIIVDSTGTKLYVALFNSKGVLALDRDPATGALSQSVALGSCITTTGTGGMCAVSPAMGFPDGLALGPSENRLYVAGQQTNPSTGMLVVLTVTGSSLAQVPAVSGGCVEQPVVNGCLTGRGMQVAQRVAIPPDGKHVYVTAYESRAVSAWKIEAGGGLSAIAGADGCLIISGGGDGCRETTLLGAEVLPLSFADDTRLYVGGSAGAFITLLTRNPQTGGLTAPGPCAATDLTGAFAGCAQAQDIFGLADLAQVPGRGELIAAARYGRGLHTFTLSANGAPTPNAAPGGCIATGGLSKPDSPCALARGFTHTFLEEFGPLQLAVSASGEYVYAASQSAFEDRAGLLVAKRDVATPTPTATPTSEPTATATASASPTVSPTASPTAVPTRIQGKVAVRFKVKRKSRQTRVSRLRISGLTADTTVEVRCKARKGCPARRATFTPAAGVVDRTTQFNKARLKGKLKLQIRLTAPGAIGRVVTYKGTGKKRPKRSIKDL